MPTIVLEEPGRFVLESTPEPAPPGPGEALVQIRRVGICGTDLHAYEGTQPFFDYPRILGHELGVEVIATGRDVSPGPSRRPVRRRALHGLRRLRALPHGQDELLREPGRPGRPRGRRHAGRPDAPRRKTAPIRRPLPRATGPGGDAGHRRPCRGPRGRRGRRNGPAHRRRAHRPFRADLRAPGRRPGDPAGDQRAAHRFLQTALRPLRSPIRHGGLEGAAAPAARAANCPRPSSTPPATPGP